MTDVLDLVISCRDLFHDMCHKSLLLTTKKQTTMKTKTLLLVGLCAIGLYSWKTQAVNTKSIPINNIEMADPPSSYEKIELQGSLMFGINPNAIVAGANDDAVYIGFNQSFGNVNISIYNAMGGLVYSTVVNTDVQQTIIIPFANVLSGTYTVEVSNANGSVEGDFDKD